MKNINSEKAVNFDLLKVSEVMKILKISRLTVLKLISTHELKGIRVGKLWRVNQSDLQHFIEEGTFRDDTLLSNGISVQL